MMTDRFPFSIGFARSVRHWLCLALVLPLLALGCNGGGDSEPDPKDGEADAKSDSAQTADKADDKDDADDSVSNNIGNNNPNLLVAIGDSVTAGTEITGPSYPARLSGILGKTVQNRGVGGATSSAAPGQASSALGSKPGYLLVMFGVNDVFREVPPDTVAANLGSAVSQARANKTIPVVATLTPNLRSDFQQGIVNAYNSRIKGLGSARIADVAREFGSGAGLMLDDGFHPNDAGTAVIAVTFAGAIRR